MRRKSIELIAASSHNLSDARPTFRNTILRGARRADLAMCEMVGLDWGQAGFHFTGLNQVGLKWNGVDVDWNSLKWRIQEWKETLGIGIYWNGRYGKFQEWQHTIGLTERIFLEHAQQLIIGGHGCHRR